MALKVAVVLLADAGSLGDMGRMANALVTVQECHEAGDEVKLIFDGAGTKWIPELSSPGHKYHSLFMSVRETVAGACQYCAGAYGVAEEVGSAGFELSDQYRGTWAPSPPPRAEPPHGEVRSKSNDVEPLRDQLAQARVE